MRGWTHATRRQWRSQCLRITIVELALAWISISYGLNLIAEVTPQAVGMIVQAVAPLDQWGGFLIVAAAVQLIGLATRYPWITVGGHVLQAAALVALGAAAVQLNPLAQIVLTIGLVLHPAMVVLITRDTIRAGTRHKE